jgi:hypothetical protein
MSAQKGYTQQCTQKQPWVPKTWRIPRPDLSGNFFYNIFKSLSPKRSFIVELNIYCQWLGYTSPVLLLLSLLNHRHRSKVCIYRYIWLGILKFFSLTRSRFSKFLLQKHFWRSLGFILNLISPAKCSSRRNVPRRNEFRRSVTGETYRSHCKLSILKCK